MEIDVEKFIAEVCSRPPLWDRNNKMYHRRSSVENYWIAVEKEMQIPREQLKKKWKYLRDQFRCECKKIPVDEEGKWGANYGSYTCWPYFNSLIFLKNQMMCRSVGTQYFGNSMDATDAVSSVDGLPTEAQYEESENTVHSFAEVKDEYEAYRMDTHVSSMRMNNRASNGNSRVLHNEVRKIEDEDEAFFASLLPHVRKLQGAQKLIFRSEILNIVQRHVYENQQKVDTVSDYS